jgi:hypothetical protein
VKGSNFSAAADTIIISCELVNLKDKSKEVPTSDGIFTSKDYVADEGFPGKAIAGRNATPAIDKYLQN